MSRTQSFCSAVSQSIPPLLLNILLPIHFCNGPIFYIIAHCDNNFHITVLQIDCIHVFSVHAFDTWSQTYINLQTIIFTAKRLPLFISLNFLDLILNKFSSCNKSFPILSSGGFLSTVFICSYRRWNVIRVNDIALSMYCILLLWTILWLRCMSGKHKLM